jgi:YgiT-type zinc finger domain-containing protein
MKCIVCRIGATSAGTTEVTFLRDERNLVLPQVPADVCGNCGEAYLDETVAAWLLDAAGTTK